MQNRMTGGRVSAAVLATAAMLLAGAGPAHAARPCWPTGTAGRWPTRTAVPRCGASCSPRRRLLTTRRDTAAARRFFARALRTLKVTPSEVVTDAALVYPGVLEELLPAAWHHVERYANDPIEADHGQLKRRLRPMRGLQTDRTAQVVSAGHAFLRICAAATTNSQSTPAPHCGSRGRSPNSPWRSDRLACQAQRVR
jgi:hypothetical protein